MAKVDKDFDPYLQWLGIRDPQRPPNHYRLLALEPYEEDGDIIQNAADQRMAHIRTYQASQYSKASQLLLNEISAAKLCLLNSKKKAAYDAQLRALLASKAPPPPPAAAPGLGDISDAPPAAEDSVVAAVRQLTTDAPRPAETYARRGNGPLWTYVGIAGAVLALVALGVVLSGDPPDRVVTKNDPPKRLPDNNVSKPKAIETRPVKPPEPAPARPRSEPFVTNPPADVAKPTPVASRPTGKSSPKFGPGKFEMGAIFSGREAIAVPHRSELEPQDFTLETWVWLDEIPSGKEARRWLINKSTNEHASGYFALLIDGDHAAALVNLGGGSEGAVRARSDAGVLKTGRWQHLAVTCGQGALTIWCDGRQVATQSLKRQRPAGSGPLVFGTRADEYGYFSGKLDEARLFGRILSAEEIGQHASCENADIWRSAAMIAGLIEAWGFESGGE